MVFKRPILQLTMHTYVVNNKPDYLEPVGMAIAEFYGDTAPAANAWIVITKRVNWE